MVSSTVLMINPYNTVKVLHCIAQTFHGNIKIRLENDKGELILIEMLLHHSKQQHVTKVENMNTTNAFDFTLIGLMRIYFGHCVCRTSEGPHVPSSSSPYALNKLLIDTKCVHYLIYSTNHQLPTFPVSACTQILLVRQVDFFPLLFSSGAEICMLKNLSVLPLSHSITFTFFRSMVCFEERSCQH